MSGGKLEGSAGAIFWRAVTNGNLIVAETVAREFEKLPLDYALALVRLYGDKNDRRYEPAALRYLERLIVEERPSLTDVATIAGLLAERTVR